VHLRYNFHHPPLTARDYTAIEHQVGRLRHVHGHLSPTGRPSYIVQVAFQLTLQLRKFSRTLDMLESPSVLRIHVSDDMRDWWSNEVARAHARAEKAALKKELGEGS
jgi:hypothetical protein